MWCVRVSSKQDALFELACATILGRIVFDKRVRFGQVLRAVVGRTMALCCPDRMTFYIGPLASFPLNELHFFCASTGVLDEI